MYYKKTAIFLLCFCISCVVNAQTADDVITKYISFIGGDQQWKTVKSIVTEGTYDYGGMVFPFTAYSKAPDKYKFIVPFKGKYFEQAFDGKSGWKIDAFKGEVKKTLLTGKPATALVNEADVELESPFINYAAKGNTASLKGIDSVNGIACYQIKLLRKDGDTETYFFNISSGELVEKQAIAKNAELDNSMLCTYFSDYREIQGLKIPFSAISKVNGQTILTIIITTAQINVPIEDKEFEP